MTIAQALKKYSKIEADLLLGHVLKQPKEFLYIYPEVELTKEQLSSFDEMAQKRTDGMPVAYLTEYKHFFGLNFKVNKNVLIPRPATEWLVEEALRIITKKQREPKRKLIRILDVGTGSGAIAVSIAFNSDSAKVQLFATDISDKALAVAKQNANAAKVKINFSKHDLLTGVKGKFDIIIANLPYVPVSDYQKLKEGLKYEPKLAITDGGDDFKLIKRLIDQLPSHLNKEAIVLLEIDPKAAAIKVGGFRKNVIRDIQGLDRFLRLTLTK